MSPPAEAEAPRLWIVLTRCYRALRQIAEHSIVEAGLGLSDFAAVDRLERKSLVVRRATESDRRAKVLELTSKGKRVVETAFRRHAVELETAMAILNSREKHLLYGLLKKLCLFAVEARI